MNENGATVYFDCLNKPQCLASAKFYKKNKKFELFFQHAADTCPPDDRMKTKVHFEEFLKKNVVKKENSNVSVLNLYKRAVNDRYKGLWVPENHRRDFLPVLRRLRNSKKSKSTKSQAKVKQIRFI